MVALGLKTRPRRWSNQYISLAKTLPEHLLNLTGDTISTEEGELLTKKIGTDNNLVIEIGSGSGGHLIGQAESNPTCFFLGVELRFKRAFRSAQKAADRGLKNIFFIRGNFLALQTTFSNECLSGVFVNFPDPWAKKRWLKHRLLSPSFFTWLSTALRPGGFFTYKTDHQSYFVQTCTEIGNHCELELRIVESDLYGKNTQPLDQFTQVKSEFEQLFISKGQPIGFVHVVRRPRENS